MTANEYGRIDAGMPLPAFLPAPRQTVVVPLAAPAIVHARWPCHAETDADLVARLEWLDDLMFAAIDGDPAALDGAAEAWKRSREDLGDAALEESRQQYVRRAQSVWNTLRNQPNHPPHKVFAAIEIISLLAKKTK